MTGIVCDATVPVIIEAGEPGEAMELIRGSEERFLERLQPLVQQENVWLDLDAVERIDAAGLSALIALYCDAHNAGHSFMVFNPRRHVREILALVGLDRILMPFEDSAAEQPRFEASAA
jgi:anti-anti-sigma factor